MARVKEEIKEIEDKARELAAMLSNRGPAELKRDTVVNRALEVLMDELVTTDLWKARYLYTALGKYV